MKPQVSWGFPRIPEGHQESHVEVLVKRPFSGQVVENFLKVALYSLNGEGYQIGGR